jgi:hypothetical protein
MNPEKIRNLIAISALSTAVLLAGGCQAGISKSSNPLTATVAGPMAGVEVGAPKILEPATGQQVAVDKQPLTLLIENVATNSPRPMTYVFEVATDTNFANKVFVREGVAPSEGGRTSLRLQDSLASERTYFWRTRAEDGANVGPYSATSYFNVFTPIVIDAPGLDSPRPNEAVSGLRPRFVIINPHRSGPVGPITYTLELATNFEFTNKIGIWDFGEQPNQTRFDPPGDLAYSTVYYWHVRASDPTTQGPWSGTLAFFTQAPPPPPPTGGGGGGGGGGPQNHVGPGPINASRASQVVFATAREFPNLTQVFGSEGEAVGAADQLLRRTIWHLQLAGFNAARQKNPSGAISSDKISIFIDGGWHCYDIYSLGVAGRATTVQFIEVPLPNPQADGGIPD